MYSYKIFGIIASLLFCFLTGCENKIEEVIKGKWSIDTLFYKGYDARVCLYSNIITFQDNETVKLPYAENRCSEIITKSTDKSGVWEIVKSTNENDTLPFKLKIQTHNEIFVGEHKIVFHRDDLNKLLKLEIWSDSLYIICRKGFFSYDENIELVKELEKISWTTRHN